VRVPWLFSGAVNPALRRPKSYFANTLILPELNLYEALKIDDPKKVEWKEHLIDLYDRDLTQAVLSSAILTKADLRYAQLQGASLTGAYLHGASLDEAQLQGALLGGAQLQGASLDGTGLWRAQLSNSATKDLARLSNSAAKDLFAPPGSPDWSPKGVGGTWTDATYTALRRSIEQTVPEGPNRNNVLERMAILDRARKGDDLASCDPSAKPPDRVKAWKNMIEAAKVDQGAYAKALAAILGGLVCSNEADRIYVLRGLLRSAPLGEDRFLETGAEMPALAKRITSPECPVSAALTDADKNAIAEATKFAVARAAASSKSP
jgi:hypothetical protein